MLNIVFFPDVKNIVGGKNVLRLGARFIIRAAHQIQLSGSRPKLSPARCLLARSAHFFEVKHFTFQFLVSNKDIVGALVEMLEPLGSKLITATGS